MLIKNKLLPESQITELINKIKQKKELQSLSENFIRDNLFEYLKQNSKLLPFLKNPKSAKYKQIIKEVRSKLRRVYGLFRIEENSKRRTELVNSLTSPKQKKLSQKFSTRTLQQKNASHTTKNYIKKYLP